jgi:hypothetical protein
MATKVTVAIEDDLEGGPADETMRFAVGSAQYEIDLNKKNARAFRKQLAPFVEHARKAGRDSAARVPHQAASAAATSGPGPKTRASRSAAAGASRPAWWRSTTPRPEDLDRSGRSRRRWTSRHLL